MTTRTIYNNLNIDPFNYDLWNTSYKITCFWFQATDKDAGKNGKIQYSLRGEDAEDFVINPETGTIYCSRPADDSNISKSFEVVAKDNDGKLEGYESALNITVSQNRANMP